MYGKLIMVLFFKNLGSNIKQNYKKKKYFAWVFFCKKKVKETSHRKNAFFLKWLSS